MVETIVREENSNSRIYIKDLGQINLYDMSLSNDKLCMTVVESLYLENSLNPPFKKLDVDNGLLKRIISLSRDTRTFEYKHKEIKEIRDELKTRYSLNLS
jgi:hypothetical protein